MASLKDIEARLARIEGLLSDLVSEKPAAGREVSAPAESQLEMRAIAMRSRQVGLKRALEEFGRAPKDKRRRA